VNEGGLKEWGISLQGSLMRGTRRDASLTEDPEGYAKALEMAVFFHRGPAFREPGGTRLS